MAGVQRQACWAYGGRAVSARQNTPRVLTQCQASPQGAEAASPLCTPPSLVMQRPKVLAFRVGRCWTSAADRAPQHNEPAAVQTF